MKVYIERNNIQMELIRLPNNTEFIAVGNFEVGIYFCDRRAHCYPRRVATVQFRWRGARRTFRHMITSVHAMSGHIQLSTQSLRDMPIRNIVTSGDVISGQARFGTAQLHSFKLLCTGSSHGKSVQALIQLHFISIHSVYDCLYIGRLATTSERTDSIVQKEQFQKFRLRPIVTNFPALSLVTLGGVRDVYAPHTPIPFPNGVIIVFACFSASVIPHINMPRQVDLPQTQFPPTLGLRLHASEP